MQHILPLHTGSVRLHTDSHVPAAAPLHLQTAGAARADRSLHAPHLSRTTRIASPTSSIRAHARFRGGSRG
ncbi:hypothetical protein B484DRAFT_445766, partial [Ochromonadaceae sp. CCMP2298]